MRFILLESAFPSYLEEIILSPCLHAKWLNTLSYLENCGARKIARCEHPTKVKQEILKHAAEEFRHALFLKNQIQKITDPLPTYALSSLLGNHETLFYLEKLNIQICRLLSTFELSVQSMKEYAYLLVTYSIECRAQELYPLYESLLRKHQIPIYVKSVILEEEEHLEEMQRELAKLSDSAFLSEQALSIESFLCTEWVSALRKEFSSFSTH